MLLFNGIISENEICLNLPKGKLPFIGRKLTARFDARDLYRDLILEHKYAEFRLAFDFKHKQLNVRLILDENLIVKFYNNIDCDEDRLKNGMYLTQKSTQFYFGLVILDKAKEVVVSTKEKERLFVLRVTKY